LVNQKNFDKLKLSSAFNEDCFFLISFPDAKVRHTAIKWISKMPDENLITILPQLVEALSYETFDLSPLAQFLLKKSMSRFEITHSLFWSLVSEVGLGKWCEDADIPPSVITRNYTDLSDPRRRRLELMLNSLLAISYHKWKSALVSQFKLMQVNAKTDGILK
jgi:hypothetical protein